MLLANLMPSCGPAPPAPGPALSGGPTSDWPAYGNDPGGARYSPLTQITRNNIGTLAVAWTYHTGDLADARVAGWGAKPRFEVTPILVDGTLAWRVSTTASSPSTLKQAARVGRTTRTSIFR
jgi:glucose dehydrogenase